MENIQGISAATLEKAREILKQGPTPELMQLLSQTGVQKDYPSGLVAYDLEPVARVLQPIITPLRNRIPRTKGKGGAAANWKQITSLSTNDASPFQAFGTKAPVVSFTSVDRSGTYRSLAKGDNVSIEAMQQARGLEDAKAQMVVRLLANVMILEERGIIGGRNAALGAVTAPTVTTVAAGGAIAANTYYVVVRACTALADSPTAAGIVAGTASIARGRKSANTAIVTGGAASVINATVPVVDGAVRYEWYVGTVNDTTTGKLEAVTTINSVSLAALAGTGAVVAADNSTDANAMDGIFAQGSGTGVFGNFGYSKQLATGTPGAGTPFQLSDVDTMLLNLYQNFGADPESLVMNPQQLIDFTNKVKAAGLIRFIVPDKGPVGQVTGGMRATGYINPITGREIELVTDPWWPVGSLFAMSLSVPVPLGEITNAWEIETQLDYYQLEYALVAPKYEVEVRLLEALKGYFLIGCGLVNNIANG